MKDVQGFPDSTKSLTFHLYNFTLYNYVRINHFTEVQVDPSYSSAQVHLRYYSDSKLHSNAYEVVSPVSTNLYHLQIYHVSDFS